MAEPSRELAEPQEPRIWRTIKIFIPMSRLLAWALSCFGTLLPSRAPAPGLVLAPALGLVSLVLRHEVEERGPCARILQHGLSLGHELHQGGHVEVVRVPPQAQQRHRIRQVIFRLSRWNAREGLGQDAQWQQGTSQIEGFSLTSVWVPKRKLVKGT